MGHEAKSRCSHCWAGQGNSEVLVSVTGAISHYGTEVAISNALFRRNKVAALMRAGNGGSVVLYGGAVHLGSDGDTWTRAVTNCTFAQNSIAATGASTYATSGLAVVCGGGMSSILDAGSVNVTGCSFTSNSVVLSTGTAGSTSYAGGGRLNAPAAMQPRF